MSETKRVLFLCNGNAGRSQIAEAVLRHVGRGQFEAVSAGTHPDSCVHPQALQTLRRNHVPAEGLAPKDVSTFAGQPFDFVITLCDRQREEPSVLEGADMIYWTFPDPAEHVDMEVRARVFEHAYRGLERRIRLLIAVTSGRGESSVPYPASVQVSHSAA